MRSPVVGEVRPDIPWTQRGDSYWMSTGIRRLTELGLAAMVLAYAGPAFGGWPEQQPRDLLLTIGLILPLAVRRRWPTGVFCFMAVVSFVEMLIGGQPLGANAALLVAFYTVATRESLPRMVLCASVFELGIVLAAIRWSTTYSVLYVIVPLSAMAVAAGVLGLNVRTRGAYLESLRDRAEQLERDRDQQTVIAIAAERARIASEMHDVVAHSLAVMTALADGARLALVTHPDKAATALKAVSETGRAAMSDMHALLGVLADRSGDEPAGTSPQPDLSALAGLTAQVTDAGLPVTFTITGIDGFPVAQGLQLVTYRVVQEALTNAIKHGGPGAHAQVDVRVTARTLSVDVVDQGGRPPVRPYGQQSTQGRGLLGMRERVAAYEGTLEVGPRPDGGWRVLVRLPRTEDDKP
jgi:signal transduction histidine kinase